jgi:hypothetical protein
MWGWQMMNIGSASTTRMSPLLPRQLPSSSLPCSLLNKQAVASTSSIAVPRGQQVFVLNRRVWGLAEGEDEWIERCC